MGDKTGIQWTDATWNPTVGCSLVSPGCTNCYAMKQAWRITRMTPGSHYEGTVRLSPSRKQRLEGGRYDDAMPGLPVWTGKIALAPEHILTLPLRWKKPRRIFVNSMSDLFHENLPDETIDRVFAVMALAPQHTFQVLTKRAERMREYINRKRRLAPEWVEVFPGERTLLPYEGGWPTNVWFGVSVEDQARKERIDDLRATPAAVRFLSCEPLLEDLGELDLTGIHWVIVGGESGPGARPCELAWIKSIIEQCAAAGVACFVKQIGANPVMLGVRSAQRLDRKGGDIEEWPVSMRVREFPRP